MSDVIVRAFPTDTNSLDYKQGPMLANNGAGASMTIAAGGKRAPAATLRWEGVPWRCAFADATLWVLAPRDTVEAYRPALERLAAVVADRGGVEQVERELARLVPGGSLIPTSSKRTSTPSKPGAVSKRAALDAVTEAARQAIEHGASMQDLRLAVFSAMGLDSDAA